MNKYAKLFLWIAAGFAGAALLQLARGPAGGPDTLPRLTDGTFGPYLGRATTPVLVDFYADWCGPCRRIAPAVARLAGANRDRLAVVKVNTDHARLTAIRHKVEGIPCLILFRQSNEVDRVTGALTQAEYQAWLDRHLPPAIPAPSP